MKKITKYIFLFLFLIISFYYIEKSIINSNDLLIQEINNNLIKYKIEPVNATIKDNTITPGKYGQEVDIKKTYKKMKKYGSYNEGLTKIKKIIPTVSISNNYDKYIKLTNNDNKKVSLIFILNNKININNLINIIDKNNINITLYIEDEFIEDNIDFIKNTTYEIELLNPKKHLFTSTKSYLESLISSELKYCITEEENIELLELCKNNKMHTIIPSLIIKKELYKNIKSNIETSPIILIYPNKYIEKELTTTINYLKKKGYDFLPLKDLLTEDL